MFPCGTSVRPRPKSSDAAAAGEEVCLPEMGSAPEMGWIEVVHPVTTSSEARRMVFVIAAPRTEVTYYDRLSARSVKSTGMT